MKGINELSLNQATMIEAMQYYVANVLFREYVEVVNVDSDSNNGFIVKLDCKETPALPHAAT